MRQHTCILMIGHFRGFERRGSNREGPRAKGISFPFAFLSIQVVATVIELGLRGGGQRSRCSSVVSQCLNKRNGSTEPTNPCKFKHKNSIHTSNCSSWCLKLYGSTMERRSFTYVVASESLYPFLNIIYAMHIAPEREIPALWVMREG